tara:strand:+ start:511 stop:1044 length:534 start_codon:yes stop_codon:yes gene_type:complete
MSTLSVNTITAETGNTVSLASGKSLSVPAGVHSPGSVIQTIQQPYTTASGISSTSYIATGLSQVITPKFATSKILVLVNLSAETYQAGNLSPKFYLQILRGTTEIAYRRSDSYAGVANNNYYSFSVHGTMNYLDSPSTTNAVTYSVNGKLSSTTNSATLRLHDSSSMSTITLMEIAQ